MLRRNVGSPVQMCRGLPALHPQALRCVEKVRVPTERIGGLEAEVGQTWSSRSDDSNQGTHGCSCRTWDQEVGGLGGARCCEPGVCEVRILLLMAFRSLVVPYRLKLLSPCQLLG